jgi:hypothetical protein
MTPLTLDAAEADMRAVVEAGDPARISAAAALVDRLEEKRPAVSLHSAALYYAGIGLKVFPLSPGSKIPFKGSNGCKAASSNHDVVDGWWADSPDANIGIATGHLVDVVDIDGQPGQLSRVRHWDAVFAKIEADCIAKVLTPRKGGMHIYVPATGDGNGAHIVEGVDYRGAGGYVVAPPSRTDVGPYRFLGTPDLASLMDRMAG